MAGEPKPTEIHTATRGPGKTVAAPSSRQMSAVVCLKLLMRSDEGELKMSASLVDIHCVYCVMDDQKCLFLPVFSI